MIKRLLCALAALSLLAFLQALLTPKYITENPEGALIREYASFAGDNDVIFIGDCEVYANFSPITLWEEFGIPSAIRGSPQQTIWQSYYLLEDTLNRETPKAVVFNVLAMKYDSISSTGAPEKREAYNRLALEGMGWSVSKIKAILASQTRAERQWESLLSYLFPILRYHDRWSSLTAEDWEYLIHKPEISHNGYLLTTDVHPADSPIPEKPLASYDFGENSWAYLRKMAALCQEKGVALVLLKAPSLYPLWHPEWDEQIRAFAREQGLLYYNMVVAEGEMAIDWNTDTPDGGLHLNVFGAEKAAAWLGERLVQDLKLPDRRREEALASLWAEKTARYEAQKQSRPACANWCLSLTGHCEPVRTLAWQSPSIDVQNSGKGDSASSKTVVFLHIPPLNGGLSRRPLASSQ